MTSLIKTISVAVLLLFGIGSFSASAQRLSGGEGEYLNRGRILDCGPSDTHYRCGSRVLPRHWRNHGGGWSANPGIGLGLYFGDVYPRHHIYPRRIIRPVRLCTTQMAVNKARSMGIRHVRAYSYDDHILIKGKKRGHRVQVAFARARGCPAIYY